LRDASDGVTYARKRTANGGVLASRDPLLPDLDEEEEDEVAAGSASDGIDTTAYGSVRVDFRNYVFSDAFEEAIEEDQPRERVERFEPIDNVDEEGRYRPKKYKLTFSPDLVYGTACYDVLYGVQGVTQ